MKTERWPDVPPAAACSRDTTPCRRARIAAGDSLPRPVGAADRGGCRRASGIRSASRGDLLARGIGFGGVDHPRVVGGDGRISPRSSSRLHQLDEAAVHVGLLREGDRVRLQVRALAQAHADPPVAQLLDIGLAAKQIGLNHDADRAGIVRAGRAPGRACGRYTRSIPYPRGRSSPARRRAAPVARHWRRHWSKERSRPNWVSLRETLPWMPAS